MLGSRSFYARINGTIYAFEAKRHRNQAVNLFCGEVVPAKTVYGKDKGQYSPVFWRNYQKWLKGMVTDGEV